LLDSAIAKDSQGKEVLYQFMSIAGFGNGKDFAERLAKFDDAHLKELILITLAKDNR